MRNRKTLQITLAAAVAVAAAATAGILLAHRGEREWTTDSPAALAELERGLEANRKLYFDDAGEHFERALDLDPDFVAAKYFYRPHLNGAAEEARRKEIEADLRQADLDRLTARERLLIELWRARRDDQPERAGELLGDYLAEHPKDPYALSIRCVELWTGRDFSEAEQCFHRLIEIDPNWVLAQNNLGYLAMAQGEWQRAEEQFAIYRYLAPDQANPHDSLAELLMLTGRWEEAREELETALAIKPDFCESWSRLVLLDLLAGELDRAAELLDRVEREERCSEDFLRHQRCRIAVWRAFDAAEWQRAWEAYDSPDCQGYYGDAAVMAYQSALFAGRDAEAAALAASVEEITGAPLMREDGAMIALHFEGIRLRHEGRPEEAVEKLREADRQLAYWNSDRGYFKLATQAELWRALSAAGRHDEAARVLEGMRAVNPEIAERWTSHPSGDAAAARPAAPAPPDAPPGS